MLKYPPCVRFGAKNVEYILYMVKGEIMPLGNGKGKATENVKGMLKKPNLC